MNNIHKLNRILLMVTAAAAMAAFATGCSVKARMARHEKRADAYFAAGDYSNAEIEYLNSIRLDPKRVHNLARLGMVYYEQGRFNRAYQVIYQATTLATNDVDLRIKLGLIYLGGLKNKEARDEAAWVMDRSPTNRDAPVLFAETVTTQAEVDEARKRLEKLTKEIGETAPLAVASGLLEARANNSKDAERDFRRALVLDPKYSEAYYALGNLYAAKNDLTNAAVDLKAAADLAPARSAIRLSYASFKIRTGDLSEGKRLLSEISKAAPDYVPALVQQAEIALAEKRYDECSSFLNQTLARDPDNYGALLLRGRMFLVMQQGEKAVADLVRTAALYDQSPTVQYHLAVAYLAVNDPVKATAALNTVLSLQPGYPDAILLLAGLKIRKGDAASAIPMLTQLINQQSRIPETYLLLANAYLIQKNPDQALSVYSKLADLFPQNAQVPFLSGMVFEQQKKLPEARKAFEKALALSPHLVSAEEELVNLDIAEKQFAAALDRVNRDMAPQSSAASQVLLAKVHIARAVSLAAAEAKTNANIRKLVDASAAQSDVNQAEEALLKSIQLDPNLTTSYLDLAQLYVIAGKEQAALDRLNGLVSKTNNAAAYMQIAMINDTLKNYSAARDAYEKVLTINPDFSPALNNLSYLYSERLGQVEKAYALAEKARQLSPHDPSTADTLGWILYKKGEYTRALGLLTESAGQLSAVPEVQLHLGLVYYMLGDEASARVALQQAASSTEQFPSKEEANAPLAILSIDVKTADSKTTADLEKRLANQPNDLVAASRLAAIYERDGALAKAAETYEHALQKNPQSAQIMGNLVRVYLQLNDSAKALELAKQAHKLVPGDPSLSSMLGRLVFQSGDYDWAASLLQEAGPKLPGEPDVQYDLAWSYYSVGRVSEAELTMRKVASSLTAAKLEDAKRFLDLLAAVKAPTQASVAQARQILDVNSNYVPAIMVSATYAEREGKEAEARALYERVLARYPAFSPAARNLSILYARHSSDDQKAYDLALKARAAFPDDSELDRTLGVLAYRRGDYTRAAQLLQGSSQTLNKDGELFYYLGMARYKLNQKPESKTALQRALELNLDSKLAEDARKTLLELK